MIDDDAFLKLVGDLKDYIIDSSEYNEEQAINLLRRLNSYQGYLRMRNDWSHA